MAEQLQAAVYQYLVNTGEKKAAKALRKAHPETDFASIEAPSLEEVFQAHVNSLPQPAAKDEIETGEKTKKEKKKKRKHAAKEETPVEETKPAEEEANEEAEQEEPADHPEKSNGSKGKKQVERFQRVVVSEVEFLDPRLVDYSHESKGDDDWGNKANQILSAVRGKDFRHEKTKKKRGTYKGGRITTGVNSIKFDD